MDDNLGSDFGHIVITGCDINSSTFPGKRCDPVWSYYYESKWVPDSTIQAKCYGEYIH